MVYKEHFADPSNMERELVILETITNQHQFQNQDCNGYISCLRGENQFPQCPGLFHSVRTLGERLSRSIDLAHSSSMHHRRGSDIDGHTRDLMDLIGATNEAGHVSHGLSLSLSSDMLLPSVPYQQDHVHSDLVNPKWPFPRDEAREACRLRLVPELVVEEIPFHIHDQTKSSFASRGTEYVDIAIRNSVYLKPTQLLLEEIVNIRCEEVDVGSEQQGGKMFRGGEGGAPSFSSDLRNEFSGNSFLGTEKSDLHVRISRLVTLLKEVEVRYERYYHQMEEVVSSFEEIAGLGAAKSYTSLAFLAMSNHFCSLRDAIVFQINLARRRCSPDYSKSNSNLSQLGLFEKEAKRNWTSVGKLGGIQNQRQQPCRGLPETSVMILRSWLFEHFLHPYPNDSEKLNLASQAGLTKNQVSNWFINARVRLWKPMIEEMYKEEFCDSCADFNPLMDHSYVAEERNPDYIED